METEIYKLILDIQIVKKEIAAGKGRAYTLDELLEKLKTYVKQ